MEKHCQTLDRSKSAAVWDCGSSLYDSFELKSFKQQLDSAIAARTLSMPHLPDRRVSAAAPPPQKLANAKKPFKLSRTINKLVRSIFRSKQSSGCKDKAARDGFFVLYDKTGALTTIPEVSEIDHYLESLSPEVNALARRTASERFAVPSFMMITPSCR